jgi:hypothetical protein
MALWPNPLTPQFMQTAIEERPTTEDLRKTRIGLSILPMKPVEEYELTWDVIRSENELAGVYAHEGIPVPGDDILFETLAADIVNLMATRIVKESDVMTLRDPGDPGLHSASRAAYRRAQTRTRRLMEWCDDTIDNLVEFLIMWALQGTITWPPLTDAGAAIGVHQKQWGASNWVLNFPTQPANAVLATPFRQAATTLRGMIDAVSPAGRAGGGVAWNLAGAQPILDIEVILDFMTWVLGFSMYGATAITSRRVFSYLANNTSVIQWVQGTEKGTNFVSTDAFTDFMKTKFDLNWRIYDAQWTYRTNLTAAAGPTINRVHFLRPGHVIILPPGEDFGFFATGPAKANNWKTGKYTWLKDYDTPPFDTEMGVGIKGFPILQRSEEIFLYDAWS